MFVGKRSSDTGAADHRERLLGAQGCTLGTILALAELSERAAQPQREWDSHGHGQRGRWQRGGELSGADVSPMRQQDGI